MLPWTEMYHTLHLYKLTKRITKQKQRQKRPLSLIAPSPDMLSIKHKYLTQRLNVAFGHLQRLELAELLAAERGQDGAQPLERRVQVVHAAALPLVRHHPLLSPHVRHIASRLALRLRVPRALASRCAAPAAHAALRAALLLTRNARVALQVATHTAGRYVQCVKLALTQPVHRRIETLKIEKRSFL